jgi:aspartate/methionine/tyrosine aminotransferase
MLNSRLHAMALSPFARLDALLAGVPPGGDVIAMSIGEPKHAPPGFVAEVLNDNAHLLGRYPPIAGTDEFRDAAAGWLARRYALPGGMIDPAAHITSLSGTREGLFMVPQVVLPARRSGPRPAVLIPDPFYHSYAGAALAAGAEPVYLPCRRETGFLPALDIAPELLDRCAAFYLCTPANPHGTAANIEYLETLIGLAREHDFVLLADECYAEIYVGAAPAGVLQACARMGGELTNVIAFHSLSKRSNVPGLRSGFAVGDARLMDAFIALRRYGAAAPSHTALAASAALWRDDAHVEENRALYREKFDAAEQIIGNLFGFYRPDGTFFLWLDVGGGEAAARILWATAGLRVLPGAYMSGAANGSGNPGEPFIRVALVHDTDTVSRALHAMAEVLH